jgi:hypothetical protein
MGAVVSKKKPRRLARPPRARGIKIIKVKPLSTEELGDLADQLANATSEAEAARLKKKFVDGFYGVRTLAV